MILGDYPPPDAVIPPLPLLCRGFGHFSDTKAVKIATFSAAMQSGTFSDHDRFVVYAMRRIEPDDEKYHRARSYLLQIPLSWRSGIVRK